MQPNLPKNSGDFSPKPVEQPILNSDLRTRIANSQLEEKTGFFKTNRYYIFFIVLGLGIIAVLGYLAFRSPPPQAPKEANVAISIDAPETLASGSEAVYKITTTNNDALKLTDLTLELVYPSSAVYVSSVPKAENISGTLFQIPDLIPGQNAAVIVKVRINGSVNDSKELLAKLSYKYSNFSSAFVKEKAIYTRLIASDIELALTGPQNATNGQILNYSIKYKNNSGSEIKNARIQLNYPSGFNFSVSDPQADIGNNIWNISVLPDKSEGVIEFRGSFANSLPGESKALVADFMILGSDGRFFTQNSVSYETAMANSPLGIFQEIESSDGPFLEVVQPGSTVQLKIKYQNNSSIAATGVNVFLSLDSKSVDTASISAEGGLINNQEVVWNASSASQLQSLAPSESGELRINFKIKNPATRDSAKNLQIASSIKIKANEFDYFSGNQLVIKIASPAKISSNLLFSNGNLPPKVGQSTYYTVNLSLQNSSNDFSDALLTAFIPLGSSGFDTSSISQAEAGKVEFDSSTGKLTWRMGFLPAYAGKFNQPKNLSFKVKLTPSASQVGQNPVLVKNIVFTGKDVFTTQEINLTSQDITTADYFDQNNYSQGQVVE